MFGGQLASTADSHYCTGTCNQVVDNCDMCRQKQLRMHGTHLKCPEDCEFVSDPPIAHIAVHTMLTGADAKVGPKLLLSASVS